MNDITTFFVKYCPPSVNHHKGWTGKSEKVKCYPSKSTTNFKKAFKETIESLKTRQKDETPPPLGEQLTIIPDKPYEGDVEVELSFVFYDKRARDVDNYAKVPIDCIKGLFIKDDVQITSLTLKKRNCLYKDQQGTSFTIKKIQ